MIANETAVVLGATNRSRELVAQWQNLPIQTKKALAVTGRDLMQAGVQPGPQLGAILGDLEYQVVTGKLPNEKSALVAAVTD